MAGLRANTLPKRTIRTPEAQRRSQPRRRRSFARPGSNRPLFLREGRGFVILQGRLAFPVATDHTRAVVSVGRRGELAAVGREDHRGHSSWCPVRTCSHSPLADVPETYGAVLARGGQSFSVRGKGEPVDRVSVALQVADDPAFRQGDQGNPMVSLRTAQRDGQQSPVEGKGRFAPIAFVDGQAKDPHCGARRNVPETDGGVAGSGDQGLSVGRKCQP